MITPEVPVETGAAESEAAERLPVIDDADTKIVGPTIETVSSSNGAAATRLLLELAKRMVLIYPNLFVPQSEAPITK